MLPQSSLVPAVRRCGSLVQSVEFKLATSLRSFRENEGGSLIVFTLYILICMMLAIGVAIDTVRFENTRARLQNTLDRSVLAAASLNQTLGPEAVVRDYFEKAGLDGYLDSVQVESGVNYREVSANSSADVGTMFMNMVGIDALSVPASGTASEAIADIEIAMVLDNSGSMRGSRLSLLQPAARNFIDAVARDDTDTDGTTSISIIPFATQVSAGSDLLSHFNNTAEHDSSYCLTFEDADFLTAEMSTTQEYRRTAHFDRSYSSSSSSSNWKPSNNNLTCPIWDERDITPWSTDAEYLKGKIDQMIARGNTSIELGAKWGTALLDPSTRGVLTAMANEGKVADKLRGQPFDYDRDNTMKILVVMSDGENTTQWDIKDGYRSGDSPLYLAPKDGGKYSYYNDRNGAYDYWRLSYDSWYTTPHYGDSAEQLTWPEVWENMRVTNFAYNIKSDALGGYYSTYFNQMVETIGPSRKNPRTSQICQAAKDAGIMIFTIGMDTYGQGDATLEDCASSPSYFYDVRSLDISTAFAAIARQINQLRLTQ